MKLKLKEEEVSIYNANKAKAKALRTDFLKEWPEFDYLEIFTEKRSNGVCRTKFWGVSELAMRVFKMWIENKQKDGYYLDVKVKYIPKPKYSWWYKPSIAIYIK